MDLKQGETCLVDFRDYPGGKHGKKMVLRTSEAIFIGFHGKATAVLEFTKPDGGKLRKIVPIRMIKPTLGATST